MMRGAKPLLAGILVSALAYGGCSNYLRTKQIALRTDSIQQQLSRMEQTTIQTIQELLSKNPSFVEQTLLTSAGRDPDHYLSMADHKDLSSYIERNPERILPQARKSLCVQYAKDSLYGLEQRFHSLVTGSTTNR